MAEEEKKSDDKAPPAGGGISEADLSRIINAAMTAHSKRLEARFDEKLATALATKQEETPPPADNAVKDAEVLKLRAEIERERKAREAEKLERDAERTKALRAEQSAALATALRDAGVTDKTMAAAAQALLENSGAVVRDDNGAIKFKSADKYGVELLVDLPDGLAAWAKSDGAAFLPPKKVNGSGNAPPRGGNAAASGKPDPKAEKLAEAREIFNTFMSGVGG